MNGVLGKKRIFILFLLLIVGGVLTSFYYKYLVPTKAGLQAKTRQVNSDISKRQKEIAVLRDEFSEFEKKKNEFSKLKKLGFLNEQNRVIARERFKYMQKISGVLSLDYEISSAKIENNKDAKRSGYTILNSPISIKVEAVDDTDIYRFIYLLNYAFPGHITISELTINRHRDVTQPLLRQIGAGRPVVLADAVILADWRTMAKIDTEMLRKNTDSGNTGRRRR